jgi:protein-tyrosine phosphatase
VVVTPHVRSDFVTDVSDLAERVGELQLAVDAAGLPVRLHRGGELGHDMVGRLTQTELQTIAQGPPYARWLLVEAPFEFIGDDFHAATDELRDRGFGVVIAHPERSADAILYGADGLRHEVERGAVGQLNAQSITGAHGADAKEAAFGLISAGLLRAVSSDAHGPTRPPLLGEARAHLIEGGVRPAVCNSLIGGCPRRLLARGVPSTALHLV